MTDPREDLAQFTFLSKYARYRPELKRRETYTEACQRVMAMHRRHVGDKIPEKTLKQIEDALINREILGSQRNMQFAGAAIERINLRGYNCSYSFFDRPEFLPEAVWLLLCGCGVGFSVQRHHVAKLPRLLQPREVFGPESVHVIADSIEGWAEAFRALFSSYVDGTDRIRFDYSQVRPEGASISTSSAKAPGPKPLRDSLEACRKLLEVVVERGGDLRPIDAYDLVMHAVSCVRAGGVRRSATIALFSPDDAAMAQAKTGDWFSENPQRRLSNNSGVLVRATADRATFDEMMRSTREFGDPGVYFTSSTEHGTNPCGEIGLHPVDDQGRSGWAFCNLTSINFASCKTDRDFKVRCWLAGVLGTIQASYMDTGYLGDVTRSIMERDALLGVSLTGMADNPEMAFSGELLQSGAEVVNRANRDHAALLGINSAARTTCVKPEGTGSLVLKCGSGITPLKARRFLRYVEGGKITDPLVQHMLKFNPGAVERSAYNPDEVKLVFPIEIDGDCWTQDETSAVDHLEKVRLVQQNWVVPGTNRGDLTHNVSNTIVVGEDEWGDVEEHIWQHRADYGGIALLGASGDYDYPQAPFVRVPEEDEVGHPRAEKARAVWHALRATWTAVDWSALVEEEDQTAGIEVVACAGGACLI